VEVEAEVVEAAEVGAQAGIVDGADMPSSGTPRFRKSCAIAYTASDLALTVSVP
jgi:hypothetical protein